MSDILVKIGADITDFSRKMAESQRALNDFTKANQETFDSFKKVGAGVTAVGVGIAAGLGGAVKTAADFEAGMSEVKAISGATGDEFAALEKRARELGGSTSFSAKEASDGLKYLALAGWDTEKMISGLEPVLHLAEAGALDLGRSADLVTDSMAGLGLGVDELETYLDKVAQTSRKSNTEIDELMEAMVVAGGTFDRFNVPLEEANSFLGILANRGFKGSEAGRALNAIMTRLTATTGPSAKALRELGVNAFDSEGNFRGMEVVMKDVEKALSGLTDKERAHYQTQIAGLDHGKSFSAMLSGLGDEYDALKVDVINSNGALQEMRNEMKNNLQGALENLKSAFEEIAISIGSALLPYVKQAAAFIQRLADWFNGLNDSTKSTIAIVTAITSVFALIAGSLLMLIGFIPQIIVGFKAIGTVFTALTGPVGLIVLAIVGIVAALVYAYNKVEWFRDMVNEAWANIKDAFFTAISWIKDNVVIPVMTEISAFFGEILGKIRAFWDENGEMIMKLVNFYFDNIKVYIVFIMDVIKTTFQTGWTIISNVIKVAWNLIKTIVRIGIDGVLGVIQLVMKLLQGDWEGAWNTIKDTVKSIWDNIKKFFEDVDLVQVGKDIINGLINGLKSMIGSVGKAVKGIGENIKNTFKNFFGIKSPSRLMKSMSKELPAGAIEGIKSMTSKVKNVTEKLSEAMTPDTQQISMAYDTPSGTYASLASAVNGTVDVNTREDKIADAIGKLESKLENLRIEMDGREFGRAVSDVSASDRNSAVRNGGRRRI